MPKGRLATDEPVVGTLDASIYRKNNFQDNSKYIIDHQTSKTMAEETSLNLIRRMIGEGRDVKAILDITGSLLQIIKNGVMSVEEAIEALKDITMELDIEVSEEEWTCIVRRLTPTETARLQGFPDDYTKIDGPETSDAPQFKSHGNSWATPCANHILTRTELELRRLCHEGTIRYATVCSGIEAHSVAVRNRDWKSIFFSEVDPFPCRVLAHHYPTVPNLGDMTQIHYDAEKGVITNAPSADYELPKEFKQAELQEIPYNVGELDVLSGGVPCTDVSIAGKRLGMAENSGTRSALAFTYQEIIDELQPRFTIYENVPGAFSSNGGADFIWFVNKCAESGYAMAWRVLDAQYVMTEEFPRAVPQRRRRIWLVGYRGNDWRVPARICFELEKDLTSKPPERVSGIGFKEITEEGRELIAQMQMEKESQKVEPSIEHEFGLTFESDDGRQDLRKVSRLIDFKEMPDEPDFSKVPMTDILTFAKKVGEPSYIGSVLRTDKKKVKKVGETMDLFSMLDGEKTEENKIEDIPEEEEWEGAEQITPAILENIGNAGILANGRICTMTCCEWTSGIQLSPEKYKAWEELVKNKEWLKANELLPDAYDETICGLEDILEENPDSKYNLSWRACFGILKRAESRGKELPEPLYVALIILIRENAGIVKWVALNGRDTKKKETDLSEKEIAKICFDKYISPVMNWDDVVPEEPKKRADDEEEEEEDDFNNDNIEEDEEGNLIVGEEE